MSTWFRANDAVAYPPILQVRLSGFCHKVGKSMCYT